MSFSFRDKTVVVTGSSRGIGRGVAAAFQRAGATLHLIADDPEIFKAAKELGSTGHQLDITDKEALTKALAHVGRIDVLVNNAGIEHMTPITDESAEIETIFRRLIEVNVIGTATVTRSLLPLMGKGSAIVNTSSVWGRIAEASFDAYVASKHAVIGLTKTWSKELGPLGIRINAVCPGWVRTEAAMRSLELMAIAKNTTESDLLDAITASQSLPGLMVPDDVADAYLFLASDYARNITGQALSVDRGEMPL